MGAFLFGRRELPKRILRKVWIRQRVEKTGNLALPYRPQRRRLPASPRPAHVLSRLNRSRVFPPMVLPEAALPSIRLSEILALIGQGQAEGQSWPRLLDSLVTSSALTWRTGARLLEKIIGRSLTAQEIAMVEGARRFWELYAQGRARMVALQTAQQLPVWEGDWAHFDRSQLVELLPGLVLADHFERHEFLANYIHSGDEPGLDFYSITGQPLFHHPFTASFRLLS